MDPLSFLLGVETVAALFCRAFPLTVCPEMSRDARWRCLLRDRLSPQLIWVAAGLHGSSSWTPGHSPFFMCYSNMAPTFMLCLMLTPTRTLPILLRWSFKPLSHPLTVSACTDTLLARAPQYPSLLDPFLCPVAMPPYYPS